MNDPRREGRSDNPRHASSVNAERMEGEMEADGVGEGRTDKGDVMDEGEEALDH